MIADNIKVVKPTGDIFARIESKTNAKCFIWMDTNFGACDLPLGIEKLKIEPFPSDVKRVVGKKEKIFRVRVGDYRIQYSVFYDQNNIFISDIDKRERAYD